jgi:hypothetical protein
LTRLRLRLGLLHRGLGGGHWGGLLHRRPLQLTQPLAGEDVDLDGLAALALLRRLAWCRLLRLGLTKGGPIQIR